MLDGKSTDKHLLEWRNKNNMAKKNGFKMKTWHGIVIVLLLLVLFFKDSISFLQNAPEEKTGTDAIEVKFYDNEKNLIRTSQAVPTFAVVNDIPQVTYVSFTVNAQNLGDTILNPVVIEK